MSLFSIGRRSPLPDRVRKGTSIPDDQKVQHSIERARSFSDQYKKGYVVGEGHELRETAYGYHWTSYRLKAMRSTFCMQNCHTRDQAGAYILYVTRKETFKEYGRYETRTHPIEFVMLNDYPKAHYIFYKRKCIGRAEMDSDYPFPFTPTRAVLLDRSDNVLAQADFPSFIGYHVDVTIKNNKYTVPRARPGTFMDFICFPLELVLFWSKRWHRWRGNDKLVLPETWPQCSEEETALLFALALLIHSRYLPYDGD